MNTVITPSVKLLGFVAQKYSREDFIHTIEIRPEGDKVLPKLVMIHGFGCGGAIFFRILKDLGDYFHIVTLDILGMGGSGRPEFTCQTTEETEKWILTFLTKWFYQTKINEGPYYLCGHSMGGYFASIYAIHHP